VKVTAPVGAVPAVSRVEKAIVLVETTVLISAAAAVTAFKLVATVLICAAVAVMAPEVNVFKTPCVPETKPTVTSPLVKVTAPVGAVPAVSWVEKAIVLVETTVLMSAAAAVTAFKLVATVLICAAVAVMALEVNVFKTPCVPETKPTVTAPPVKVTAPVGGVPRFDAKVATSAVAIVGTFVAASDVTIVSSHAFLLLLAGVRAWRGKCRMFVAAEVATQYATTLSNGARAYWLRTVPVAELALDLIVNVCAVSWLMNTYSEILLLSTAVDDPALLLKACVEQAKILRS
jgi:hypothetical protein